MIIADVLLQDFVWEVIKFLFMGVVVVCGVCIGIKLRKHSDAKKADKEVTSPVEEIDSKDSEN